MSSYPYSSQQQDYYDYEQQFDYDGFSTFPFSYGDGSEPMTATNSSQSTSSRALLPTSSSRVSSTSWEWSAQQQCHIPVYHTAPSSSHMQPQFSPYENQAYLQPDPYTQQTPQAQDAPRTQRSSGSQSQPK